MQHRAVEINSARFELLKGNVKKSIAKSAHKTKTVRFFNDNFLDVLEAEKGAIGAKRPVVFIDPPWGGEAYKKKVEHPPIIRYARLKRRSCRRT